MGRQSRFPWYAGVTIAVAIVVYAFAYFYVEDQIANAGATARSLQQVRLNQASLDLEDYLAVTDQITRYGVLIAPAQQDPAGVRVFVRRGLRGSDRTQVSGVGIFYEPNAIPAAHPRYGAYDAALGGGERMTEVTDAKTYDYTRRPWYIAALRTPGHATYTGPYTSRSGNVFIGESGAFLIRGRIGGVVLVEVLQSALTRVLQRGLSKDDNAWITGLDGAIVLGKATPVSSDTASTAAVRLRTAPWTVHLASVFPNLWLLRSKALSFGIGATSIYWCAVALLIVAFVRARRYKLESQGLREAAEHDELTGLPNRAFIVKRIGEGLAALRSGVETQFAVLFIDMDGFAIVNDSHGHAAGDVLLRAIGARLLDSLSEKAALGRLGGDEFVVYLPGIDAASAEVVAAELIRTLHAPFEIDSRESYVSASIGIVMGDVRYVNALDLLRDADAAMFASKRAGRGSCAIFDRAMYDETVAQVSLEHDLRKALADGRIVPRYQPVVDIRTGIMHSAEALARWKTPQGIDVSPTAFIPIAERCGLVEAIDRAVMQQACRDLKRLHDRLPELMVAVNLSATYLNRRGLPVTLSQLVIDAGLDTRSIKLELTETSVMERAHESQSALEALRDLGFAILIDDFGTGHSSLSYIQRLPITGLKIDRSFVTPMVEDEQSAEIVRAIVALAKTLRLQTVAEGVEDETQLAMLRAMGVDFAQGFLFAPALDIAALEEFTQRRSAPVQPATT